jgi:ketosteroid isomerase-like protein
MVGSTAWRNNATGKTFETSKVDVWRLRDGRALEFYEYYDTADLAKAASPS